MRSVDASLRWHPQICKIIGKTLINFVSDKPSQIRFCSNDKKCFEPIWLRLHPPFRKKSPVCQMKYRVQGFSPFKTIFQKTAFKARLYLASRRIEVSCFLAILLRISSKNINKKARTSYGAGFKVFTVLRK
jgi:hypothetical protein